MITINIAAHGFIALIVAVHYAIKQGDKASVRSLLDSFTPEQQLQFLFTKDKKDMDGNTAVQCAPTDERKEIDKMLRQYMSEADFEVNYGELTLLSMLAGFEIRQWISFKVCFCAFSNCFKIHLIHDNFSHTVIITALIKQMCPYIFTRTLAPSPTMCIISKLGQLDIG